VKICETFALAVKFRVLKDWSKLIPQETVVSELVMEEGETVP